MAVTTRTQSDLSADAMRHLGLLQANDSPAGPDDDYNKRRYAELMEELKDFGFAYWALDEIPSNVYSAMTELLGLEISEAYGIFYSVQERETRARLARSRLGRRTTKQASGEETRVDYF
jgi:hypothetical protein